MNLGKWIHPAVLISAALGSSSCVEKAAPEPVSDRKPVAQSPKAAEPVATTAKKAAAPAAKPAADTTAASGDPHGGKFTIEDATKDLPGNGKLMADIDTDAGKLECELYADKAPTTVANFIGLARGTRAWKKKGKWVTEPLYDGTVFHRVIKGFMIQGGDPNGNGSGGPGFQIPDEIWPGAKHDERGQLCMANRGPNTNGSQFFIMDGKAAHLDGGYTIFGKCSPESVIEKIAATPVRGDRASDPPKIKSVKIRRGK